jgi:hypothetical protein
MDDVFDVALEKILEQTQIRGGLTVTIAEAQEFVRVAQQKGVAQAKKAALKRFTSRRGAVEDFAERLAKEASVVRKERNSEPEPPEPGNGEARIEDLKVSELKALAKELGIEGFAGMKRIELIEAIGGVEEETTE